MTRRRHAAARWKAVEDRIDLRRLKQQPGQSSCHGLVQAGTGDGCGSDRQPLSAAPHRQDEEVLVHRIATRKGGKAGIHPTQGPKRQKKVKKPPKNLYKNQKPRAAQKFAPTTLG
jgi:hypothetical protein